MQIAVENYMPSFTSHLRGNLIAIIRTCAYSIFMAEIIGEDMKYDNCVLFVGPVSMWRSFLFAMNNSLHGQSSDQCFHQKDRIFSSFWIISGDLATPLFLHSAGNLVALGLLFLA